MNDEKWVGVSNAMIQLLTPEELERFAEAEKIVQESEAEIAKMIAIATAKADPLIKWEDAETREIKELLSCLPISERNAILAMEGDEIERYADLYERGGQASCTLCDLLRVAGKRQETSQ
jgi:hypothetical protein